MNYNDTLDYIKNKTTISPMVGIILGSGLGGVSELINDKVVLPYNEIPGFIQPTTQGHLGNLIFGFLNEIPVVAMQGRNHFYEGHSMKEITYPIRIIKLLGVNYLITSNATGGINQDFEVGDIMIVNDHINLMGYNPLIGLNEDDLGTRFPDMSEVYNQELIQHTRKVAEDKNIKIRDGVLVALSGPTYETPAEFRFLKTIGGDAVGMSTIPETIVANHMSMKILSLSLITNVYRTNVVNKTTHEEVKEVANKSTNNMNELMFGILNFFKK